MRMSFASGFLRNRALPKVFILAATAVISLCPRAVGAATSASAAIEHYRVFTFRSIPAERAEKFLADANIGTASLVPGTGALQVTASAQDLIRAAALLKLVDSNEPYAVRRFRADIASPANVVAARIRDLSTGTFLSPPAGTQQKAIIDFYGGRIIAVAPVSKMEKISAIIEETEQSNTKKTAEDIEELYKSMQGNQRFGELPGPGARAAAGKTEAGAASADEAFSELMGALAQAERSVAAPPEPEAPEMAEAEPEAPSEEAPEAPASKAKEPNEQEAEETGLTRRDYTPEPTPDTNVTLELELPEKLPIIELLDLMGKYLHLNYMYDEAELKAAATSQVNLKVQGPVKVGELYPLIESVLKFRGFVMSRSGNLVTVTAVAKAMDLDPMLVDAETGKIRYGDVIITRIFDLKYADVASAQNLLTQMKLGATIIPVTGTGTLIVTGYTAQMNRIEELLTMIDKPGRPKEFKFRQLKYTMAKVLAPKIKTLVEQMGDIAITVSAGEVATPGARPSPVSRVRPQQPPQAQPPGAAPVTGADTTKPTVFLDADDRTNRILMIGQEHELSVVEDLIDALDVEQQDLRVIRVYEIQNVDATEVQTKLAELGIITGGTGGRMGEGRITGRTIYQRETAQPGVPPGAVPPTAAVTGPGASSAEPLAEEPQVVVLEATNSLLVNATAEQHMRIATIIGYVDSETIQQAIPYVIYKLENQKPEDLSETLTKLIQETIKDPQGKVEKIVQRQEDNIIIVPDEGTFSLIVYASKKNQEWISNLIKTLDKRRPQVLIDVTLVEVRRTDDFSFDLQVASKYPRMEPGGAMTLVGSVLEPFPENALEGFANPKAGIAQGFYSDRHIQMLLNAIQTKGYGRVLAKPKILVNDGEEGLIKTTDTTNVKIETLVPGTDNQDPFSTSSFQPYEAGIELKITPNISEGDLLLLEVALNRTDFGETPEAGSPPDTTSSEISTLVTVPNDRTIILGGLVKLNQAKGGSKVPILGDIPLVGGLFRSTSNNADDSKLYIFVKANILRPEETLGTAPELVRISERSRAAFERFESEFQRHEDWPGIKPSPIDPLHVLDEE